MEVTRKIAMRVRDTVDAGLVQGVGEPIPGQMCVEAAVCYALGLPHGDDPGCVAQSLRALKIRLNDSSWSSVRARASGLRRLAIAQLGTAGVIDDPEFMRRVAEMTIRRVVPLGLRAAARVNPAFQARLEAAAVACEVGGTADAAADAMRAARAAVRTAASAAVRAAADAAANAAANAADAAANAAARAAADAAANAAAYAADAAANAAARAAAYAAADAAAYAANAAAYAAARAAYAAYITDALTCDDILSQFAEWVVEILIDLKAPGCEWLDLVPLTPPQTGVS
jgi:hypothetical protein